MNSSKAREYSNSRIRDFRGLSPKSFDGRGNLQWELVNKLFSQKLNTIRSIN